MKLYFMFLLLGVLCLCFGLRKGFCQQTRGIEVDFENPRYAHEHLDGQSDQPSHSGDGLVEEGKGFVIGIPRRGVDTFESLPKRRGILDSQDL